MGLFQRRIFHQRCPPADEKEEFNGRNKGGCHFNRPEQSRAVATFNDKLTAMF